MSHSYQLIDQKNKNPLFYDYFSMTNSYSNRQLIFADDNNDKQTISVNIVEVF